MRPEQLKTPHRSTQQGFTLIELLVVLSILGILLAVVSLSLVGVNGHAKAQADKTELEEVQSAFDSMVIDQTLDPSTMCPSSTTNTSKPNDLSTFPNGHPLYPGYIRQQFASQPYSCTPTGEVTSP